MVVSVGMRLERTGPILCMFHISGAVLLYEVRQTFVFVLVVHLKVFRIIKHFQFKVLCVTCHQGRLSQSWFVCPASKLGFISMFIFVSVGPFFQMNHIIHPVSTAFITSSKNTMPFQTF